MTSTPRHREADADVQIIERAAEAVSRLVREPSTGPGPALERCFDQAVDMLASYGIDSEIVRPSADAPVLEAKIHGDEPGPTLMLQGHLDVVPEGGGWGEEPFSGSIVDGHVHGRGSCDMKGGVVAAMLAMIMLRGRISSGTVKLLISPDEESGSERGLIPYLAGRPGPVADWAVCAEPTALDPFLGNRGLIWARVRVRGRSAHAGMPHAGLNPVPVLAAYISSLEEVDPAADGQGAATLTPTTVHAGDVINAVPSEAVVGLDRRLPPGADAAAAEDSLREHLAAFAHHHPELAFELEVEKAWPACELKADSVLARAALEIAGAVRPEAAFGFDDAANDASFLAAVGVPTLIWGPGEPDMAHAANERIEVRQVEEAARMYRDLALRLQVVNR